MALVYLRDTLATRVWVLSTLTARLTVKLSMCTDKYTD